MRETETAGRGGLARDLRGKERNTLEKIKEGRRQDQTEERREERK